VHTDHPAQSWPERSHLGKEGHEPDGEETLPELLTSVARELRGSSRETLTPWDITPSSLRALRTLSHHGTMHLSHLSERLHIAPRSTTEVVDALESRDLVRRRPDPDDRRATLVEVTEHGAAVLTEIRDARGSATERIFGQLAPADQSDLARILRTLRSQLRAPPDTP
jgi:DNA-binding MarR family transcriptional regulator